MFSDMTPEEITAQFDIHDLDADGIVTIEEAYHVFTHEDTVEVVTEKVQKILEEVADEDGNFDETEFLAAFNVLQSSGMLPETTSAEVVEVFDYVLEQYNQDAAEPAESIPSIALFVVMKDVVGEAWTKFIEQVEQTEAGNI